MSKCTITTHEVTEDGTRCLCGYFQRSAANRLHELTGWPYDIDSGYSFDFIASKIPNSIVFEVGDLHCFALRKLGDNTYAADYWRVRDGVELPAYGRIKTRANTSSESIVLLAIHLVEDEQI